MTILGTRFTSFKVITHDPATGDELTFSDRVSWGAQNIIRRWSWVIFNVIFSLLFWLHFHLLTDPAVAWNVSYSLLAIVVESVVGIGMFAQTKRDAIILRHVRDVADNTAHLTEEDALLLREIHKKICKD